jgi:hypothetical protein
VAEVENLAHFSLPLDGGAACQLMWRSWRTKQPSRTPVLYISRSPARALNIAVCSIPKYWNLVPYCQREQNHTRVPTEAPTVVSMSVHSFAITHNAATTMNKKISTPFNVIPLPDTLTGKGTNAGVNLAKSVTWRLNKYGCHFKISLQACYVLH